MNTARRHLTPEEIRTARQSRVADLRQQGKSLRTIGEELGIDQKQVQRDLGSIADTVRNEPDRVTTSDGRTYPARRQTTEEREASRLADMTARAEKAPPSDAWEVRLGDCLEELKRIEPGTVRLAFADPPYNSPWGDRREYAAP